MVIHTPERTSTTAGAGSHPVTPTTPRLHRRTTPATPAKRKTKRRMLLQYPAALSRQIDAIQTEALWCGLVSYGVLKTPPRIQEGIDYMSAGGDRCLDLINQWNHNLRMRLGWCKMKALVHRSRASVDTRHRSIDLKLFFDLPQDLFRLIVSMLPLLPSQNKDHKLTCGMYIESEIAQKPCTCGALSD